MSTTPSVRAKQPPASIQADHVYVTPHPIRYSG
jgi:hypothetical protein